MDLLEKLDFLEFKATNISMIRAYNITGAYKWNPEGLNEFRSKK